MSKDIGKSLQDKTDTIIKSWVEYIREDRDIKSSKSLAYKSVRNSLPIILKALATLLSDAISDRPQDIESSGWEHGLVRAQQGYDVGEIVREYSLLRNIIFAALKPDLLTGSGSEILQNIELIDSVIDRVISLSLKSYVEARFQELEEVRSQLLLTNQELTRLVETQREDLSHLAHELKSPLNSIMGFSTLLLQQQQKDTLANSSLNLTFTKKVINSSKQLLRLINDTLEMSRYEAGKMKLNLETIDLRSLASGIIEVFEPSAKQKNLEIIFNCNLGEDSVLRDRSLQQVLSDPLRLQQIITNLVSNAIRYTESGTISITCQTIARDRERAALCDRWTLIVADTGIGISPDIQKRIFEPYYRVGSKDGYSADSTGLGLAIVDKLVKLLQGEIDLVSQIDVGSTFTITFPITPKPNTDNY